MRSRLRKLFTVVGAITCALLVMVCMAWGVTCVTRDGVPSQTVIELRLDRPLNDGVLANPIAGLLSGGGTTVREVVEGLARAGKDDRVAGMIVYIDDVAWGMARAQEIRAAIVAFREQGKFAIAFSESFGELAAGNQGYYVATACDEIWLQPTGSVGLTGMMSEAYFLKGALEKAGIEAEGEHRKEYKNAFNTFTERRFTEAHREAAQTLIDDMFGQLVRDVAAARGTSEDELRTLIDDGPFLAREAHTAGLVDGLAYRDEIIEKVKVKAGAKAELLYLEAYRERAGGAWADGTRIALISGVGTVARGESSIDPLGGDQSMGSDTITSAFRAAVADEDVKAIVFRVDSPGGSPVASDAIWREVERAKAAGKPVIVSMGNVAASGGYYFAAGASKIVAQPGTVTGSIGVLGGKPVTRAAWNKLGVTWDYVTTSANGDFYSHLSGYDAAGRERLGRGLDRIYEDFTGKVAEGRGLTAAQVEALAKGRVWSGERALQLGLVDALGGLTTALALARADVGLADDAPVELVEFPEPQGWAGSLFGDGASNSEGDVARIELSVQRWRAMAAQLKAAGVLAEDRGALTMTPLTVGP